MFYKRIVVYIPDEKTYKALKHKLVDDGLSINSLMLKLISQYVNRTNSKPVETKATTAQPEVLEEACIEKQGEGEFWEKEAKDFDKAMPRHSRPRKGPAIEPVEMSIRRYEKRNSIPASREL